LRDTGARNWLRIPQGKEGKPMKRMLDIKELAIRIGLRPQTIRNKLNCGTFPIKTKKIGRKLLWDIAEVDRFLDGLKPIN